MGGHQVHRIPVVVQSLPLMHTTSVRSPSSLHNNAIMLPLLDDHKSHHGKGETKSVLSLSLICHSLYLYLFIIIYLVILKSRVRRGRRLPNFLQSSPSLFSFHSVLECTVYGKRGTSTVPCSVVTVHCVTTVSLLFSCMYPNSTA